MLRAARVEAEGVALLKRALAHIGGKAAQIVQLNALVPCLHQMLGEVLAAAALIAGVDYAASLRFEAVRCRQSRRMASMVMQASIRLLPLTVRPVLRLAAQRVRKVRIEPLHYPLSSNER